MFIKLYNCISVNPARFCHNQKMLTNMQHETSEILEQAFTQRGVPKVSITPSNIVSLILVGYSWLVRYNVGRKVEKSCNRATEKSSGELSHLVA